ncbi:outer membrane protein [Fodinibius halophilus]|uniref:Porin family protein n=1 Tax=Fodinibius halophilus TaxID=1736908 RepID=A0A6M1SVG7_9BACT|nr:hypothetical protein [Fodinibius halophilus]NGP87928.1 hypothetical protein [Fodinibius halophilus]
MKKLLTLGCLILGIAFLTNSNTYAQDIKAGGGLAYGTEIESIGIQAGAVMGFSDSFRGAADFIYFFGEEANGVDTSWWELNANVHYVFLSEATMTVYGLGGLNYATVETTVSAGGFTASGSASEVGLNLGGGAEFGIGFADLYTELKYVLGDADQLGISAGLRFGF